MPKVRGSGSIAPLENKPDNKCRHWQLRVSTGRDLATGKYNRVSRNFTGTKSEAQKALRDLIKELEGNKEATGKTTYSAYTSLWLDKAKSKVTPATYRRYKEIIRTGMLHLRNARMAEITWQVMESVYEKLQNGQTLSGKPWGGTSVKKFAHTHSSMFKQALKEGVIPYNPCDLAETPKSDTKERVVVPAHKLSVLLDKLDPADPTQFCIRMILRLGLRRGEAGALCIGDFDFENKTVRIEKSRDRHGNIGSTKTQAGRRTLPMPATVEDDVRIRIKTMESESEHIYEETGELFAIDANTPLLSDSFGVAMNPDCIKRWWDRHREEFGFDGITIHDLRHSYLTAMARKKIDPKLLQKLAGHTSYTTTMQIYVHVDDEDLREAVKLMDW